MVRNPSSNKSPVKLKVRREKVMCMLSAGMRPQDLQKEIQKEQTYSRQAFYGDIKYLNTQHTTWAENTNDNLTFNDVWRLAAKTKIQILRNLGHTQAHIAHLMGYSTSGIHSLLQHMPETYYSNTYLLLEITKERRAFDLVGEKSNVIRQDKTLYPGIYRTYHHKDDIVLLTQNIHGDPYYISTNALIHYHKIVDIFPLEYSAEQRA